MSPWKLKSPCSHPDCPNLKPCPLHAKPPHWSCDKRPQSQERGYGTGWKKARVAALKRFDFTCQRCGRRAVVVHHMDGDPENNDQSNLMPMCRPCHEAHHGRKR